MKALSCVLLIAFACVLDFASDIYFRVGAHDHINGTDAHAYDVVSTILILVGVLGLMKTVFDD